MSATIKGYICRASLKGALFFRRDFMIKIAIVEDSEEDAKTLSEYCRRYAEEKGRQFSVELFDNGFNFITKNNLDYDIIMLDIKMPYMNGMQTAQKIREANDNVCIIFITSMQQYAIHGYSVHATDFIVKPVKYSLFSFKFDRVMSILDKNSAKRQNRTIIIKTNRAIKHLQLSDIVYIETQKHKLIYHTISEDYEAWGSMKEVLLIIQSDDFALCNSGYYVNLKYVEQVTNNEVVVPGASLPMSRTKRKSFLDALTAYCRDMGMSDAGRPTGDKKNGDNK